MTKCDPIALSRDLARTSIAANDPTGWFETLYRAVEAGETELPWDRAAPNPLLVEWFDKHNVSGAGRPAAVVGFGNGRDAEFIAIRGFATTAFEVSETAVSTARKRWPGSPVNYVKGDLLALPPEWNQAFSLVLESLTIQSLPRDIRRSAIEGVRSLVAPGGTLLVIATAIADDAPVEKKTRPGLSRKAKSKASPATACAHEPRTFPHRRRARISAAGAPCSSGRRPYSPLAGEVGLPRASARLAIRVTVRLAEGEFAMRRHGKG